MESRFVSKPLTIRLRLALPSVPRCRFVDRCGSSHSGMCPLQLPQPWTQMSCRPPAQLRQFCDHGESSRQPCLVAAKGLTLPPALVASRSDRAYGPLVPWVIELLVHAIDSATETEFRFGQ